MTRGSFFKSLAAAIIAPNIVIGISQKLATKNITSFNGSLINDLNLITPHFYRDMVRKYGQDNYLLVAEILGYKL